MSYFLQRLEAKTAAHDSYVCGVGMLGCVAAMGLGVALAAYNIYAFWVFVFIGEVCLYNVLLTSIITCV